MKLLSDHYTQGDCYIQLYRAIIYSFEDSLRCRGFKLVKRNLLKKYVQDIEGLMIGV